MGEPVREILVCSGVEVCTRVELGWIGFTHTNTHTYMQTQTCAASICASRTLSLSTAPYLSVNQVDLYNTGILVESESTCTKEAMMNVVREVSRLEREEMQQDMDKEQEEEMQQKEAKGVGERVRKKPRQKYHFTLIR